MEKLTFKNGDTLELKNIKYCEFASRETHCFEGNLCVNGRSYLGVFNSGQGGADEYYYLAERVETLEKHIADLNPNDTLEFWTHRQVSDYITAKKLKRLMRTHVVYTLCKSPKVLHKKPLDKNKGLDGLVHQRYLECGGKVLNEMPLREAINYCQEWRLI